MTSPKPPMPSRSYRMSRRAFLLGSTTCAAALVCSRRASAAGRIIVRTIGGSTDDAVRVAIWDPFTKETGIQVEAVPMTGAKFLAMAESKNIEVDVAHAGPGFQLTLSRKGALEKINYKAFKYTNPDDVAGRREDMIPVISYAYALGYSTEAFATGRHPRSWADFWDTKTFPGHRAIHDISLGQVPLEFALLADGVPLNRLYPIDVERAFKVLDRIKPAIKTFWKTGAAAEQLFSSKEIVLGTVGDGRMQRLIDKGAPLGLERNQQQRDYDFYSILKDAPNRDNAERYIDFALQPARVAEFSTLSLWGPTNKQAFKHIKADVARKLATHPEYDRTSFDSDFVWWADNRDRVSQRWQQWVLQR